MKIGCSTWSFHRDMTEKRLTLEGFLEACANFKMDGVELVDFQFPAKDASYLQKIKKKIDSFDLELSALAVSNDFIKVEPKELQKQVEYVSKWIRMAARLNANVLRVFGGEIREGIDSEKAYELVMKGLQGCIGLAERHGVTLALENHGTFTSNPNIVLKLIKEFESKSLRSCLDTGNFPPEIRYKAIKMVAPFAAHVHAKAYNFDKEGNETSIDYEQVFSILRESGYNRFISIEYEGSGDETKGVGKSFELLRRFLK